MVIRDQEIDSTRLTWRGQGGVFTEDEEGAGSRDGGEVDKGGAEVEATGLVEEALHGGVVDAGAEEVGEERGREEKARRTMRSPM